MPASADRRTMRSMRSATATSPPWPRSSPTAFRASSDAAATRRPPPQPPGADAQRARRVLPHPPGLLRRRTLKEHDMPRHRNYLPQGVIPAALLPFNEDFSIDEVSYRSHLRDIAAVVGISAITINAHASEVASCSFDEQQRVLAITQDEIGARLPIVNGIYSEGPFEAARLAKMAHAGGASGL